MFWPFMSYGYNCQISFSPRICLVFIALYLTYVLIELTEAYDLITGLSSLTVRSIVESLVFYSFSFPLSIFYFSCPLTFIRIVIPVTSRLFSSSFYVFSYLSFCHKQFNTLTAFHCHKSHSNTVHG